jgi:SAM-dependent methyltransferase
MSSSVVRRLMDRAGRELVAASEQARWRSDARNDFYGARYFGSGRDPSGDRAGCSGYATYDRLSSNADVAGFVLWRTFGGAVRTLDVGCATGYLVEVLRELGVDAQGCDVSGYAVNHAAPGAKGFIRIGDLLAGLPYADGEFDVVTALETLEHLPPSEIEEALRELRRVCRGFVWATIPSFGPNGGGGPDGYFPGKIREETEEFYNGLGPAYEGPVPYHDLARDAAGEPIEGHLTIASFSWWTSRFAEAGFERRADVERRIYDDLGPSGLQNPWDVYVLAAPGADGSISQPRSPERALVDLGLRHPLFGT